MLAQSKPAAKDEILAAAFRCLRDKGSAAVTLRDIARESGVALSQIHYYFGSKEGLLVAAATQLMRQQVAQLQAELDTARSGAERLGRAIAFLRSRSSSPSCWQRVYLDLLSMAAWSPKLAEETRRLQEELVDVIFSETAKVARPEVQSRPIARVVLAALDGLALQAIQGVPPTEMSAAYEALALILAPMVR